MDAGPVALALIAFAFLLVVQDPAAAPAEDLYQAPVIRPFEPDWDFSVDPPVIAPDDPGRAAAPVTLDRYDGSYERPPTATEIAYLRGLQAAEARRDSLMGPLDGLWRVREVGGADLLQILLTDPGDGGPIVGAWRDVERAGATARLGVLTVVARRGAGLQAIFRTDGSTVDNELEVQLSARGVLTGALRYEGRTRNVTLVRER